MSEPHEEVEGQAPLPLDDPDYEEPQHDSTDDDMSGSEYEQGED